MSSYSKPQSPLYHKAEDTYFYPLTTADQVIMDDNSRLNAKMLTVDTQNANEAEPNTINADTLGGYAAGEYIRKDQVSVEVNYSVVGSPAEPTNPTQNMIWIETSTPIGRVFFGNNEPNETFNDGDVWICTGTKSNVAFNALRIGGNYVNMIYPISAKQYVGNEFVNKTAKSWQNNEWVNLSSDIILYSYGTLNTTYDCSGAVVINPTYFGFSTTEYNGSFGKRIVFTEKFNPAVYSTVSISYARGGDHRYSSHELVLLDDYGNAIVSVPLSSSEYAEIDLSMISDVTSCCIAIRSYNIQSWGGSGGLTASTQIFELAVRA